MRLRSSWSGGGQKLLLEEDPRLHRRRLAVRDGRALFENVAIIGGGVEELTDVLVTKEVPQANGLLESTA